MAGPKTYTGEDMVEIFCHGGAVQPRRVLDELVRRGLRPAEAGEFSRRAVLNGRLSLLEAEAVGELVEAVTDRGAMAVMAFQRETVGTLEGLRADVLGLVASLEAGLDFPDDVPCVFPDEALERLSTKLRDLVAAFDGGRIERSGCTVVFTGSPNVGKSSIFNRLLGTDRAIVTDEPGTTRDVVEESWRCGGRLFRLVDTAGLRDAQGAAETEGIRRARRAVADADIVVEVHDASAGTSGRDAPGLLRVGNKADLMPGGPSPAMDGLLVSARTGEGFDDLVGELCRRFDESTRRVPPPGLITSRQRSAASAALAALERARGLAEAPEFLDLVAQEARQASLALARLVGDVGADDILDEVFRRFCIGK